jgi:hypothetical protein
VQTGQSPRPGQGRTTGTSNSDQRANKLIPTARRIFQTAKKQTKSRHSQQQSDLLCSLGHDQQQELDMSDTNLDHPRAGIGGRQQPDIAQALARDQEFLDALYWALSRDIVFRTGPVRIARRDWSVELLTIEGRVGAWLVEGDTLAFFEHADLLENDFVPAQDAEKAQFRAADVREALQQSRSAISPYLKRLMAQQVRAS